jgi:apolipoprotein N-acyltransferase
MMAFLLATLSAGLVGSAGLFDDVLWPLGWIALVPLFLALRHTSPGRAFVLGWWTEAVITWLGFYWLVGTMVRYGAISLPVSLLFFAVIGFGCGVRLGIFAWWLRFAALNPAPWWYRLALPACTYVALDYLFPRVFPWYLGFLQYPAKPLIQIADVTGIHGVTFLLVACSTVVATCISRQDDLRLGSRSLMGGVVGVLLLANVGYGLWRTSQIEHAMQQAPSLRLGLVQPDIGVLQKSSRSLRQQHLRMQIEMSRTTLSEHPDLIIWPETSYPFPVPIQAQRLALPPMPADRRTHWLVGALTYDLRAPERHIFNSALLAGPDARIIGRYDKRELLAFGEYIPLQHYFPFLRNIISPTIGNLTAGDGGLVTLPGNIAIGSLICYEDILPALGRQAVRQGAQLLVNLTNDAWFGRTSALYLHHTLAAFRAIENRVYLVRVTNTGLTSIIDALGREQASLPIYRSATLVGTVRLLRLSTLYTRFGDWFAWLCSLTAVLLPLVCWQRRRNIPGRSHGRQDS